MKKIIFTVAILIFIFIINNLVHSIYSLWQKQDVLVKAARDLQREKSENKELQKQLAEVKEQFYIEEQARDKLMLVKPGENMVVIPNELIVSSPSAVLTPTPMPPNWKQWWNLFF